MKKINTAVIFTGFCLVALVIVMNRKELFKPGGPLIVYSSGTIQSGSNIKEILTDEALTPQETRNLINKLHSRYDIRRIQPGQTYEIYKTTFGVVSQFNYWTSAIDYYAIQKSTDGKLSIDAYAVPSSLEYKTFSGTVETSLYEAMVKTVNSPELTMKFADIFSWQIDFFTDLRQGDSFKLVYEVYKYKNGVKKDGNIIAARFNGKQVGLHEAVYFASADKKFSDYYSPDGGSLKKIFLRAPLNFRRISSFFSLRRFHPILRYFRPHLGIDYSAASGTPVVSIGDGTVSFAGRKGGFGKLVIIRHNSTFTTMYGHLSRFGKRVSSGSRVNQGQVIGYVGATGLATGPHLDFRISKNGSFVNFLKLKFPPAANIPREYAEEFSSAKAKAFELLDETGSYNKR